MCTVGRGNPKDKKAARWGNTERPLEERRASQMYTDYGYEVDGVEYATLDEAIHRDDDDDA